MQFLGAEKAHDGQFRKRRHSTEKALMSKHIGPWPVFSRSDAIAKPGQLAEYLNVCYCKEAISSAPHGYSLLKRRLEKLDHQERHTFLYVFII